MSDQRFHDQQVNEERSLMSQREHQQENGSIRNSDIEKQSGGQDNSKGPSIVKWHAIFIVSCAIAVLYVDPLFLYLPVINKDDNCFTLDGRLMVIAICFRSMFDMIYAGNIIFAYFSRRNGQTGLAPYDRQPRQIIKKYLRTYFIIDILFILPLPQVLLPITFTKMGASSNFLEIRKVISLFVLLQYVPRVLRIYVSWKNNIKSYSKLYKRTAWIKASFNILLYIIASHVLGGLWYFFSIQRVTTCWHKACEKDIRCTPNSFICGRNSSENYTFLDGACPIKPPNTTLFDFGIFQNALESGIVSSTNIPQKIMHCFWWGLRNLSSLGQNLQTSTYFWENCFAVFISIYSLLLFLYFIGNAQTFMQMATQERELRAAKKLEMKAEKTQVIRHSKMGPIKSKIKSWMARNQLPDEMEERIINCIQHRLEENKDFDMEEPILQYLSNDLITEIKRHLCLPLLKKVENHGDQNLLERICDSLEPKYYNEGIYVLRKGEPLMMLFITQGSLRCFETNNGENSMGTDSGGPQDIGKGTLYGEELLWWRLNNCSSSHQKSAPPGSTKIVKTTSKVEAFALTANDLKNLVPMHTRAAEATKIFVNRVFGSYRKENKNENSPKFH